MASTISTALSTGHDVPTLMTAETTASSAVATAQNVNGVTTNGSRGSNSSSSQQQTKYRHVAAAHSKARASCLSHDSDAAPSFIGFRNLLIIVVVVMNLRLVIENFMKYGVLICIRCHDYQRKDVILGLVLYALVPCHLFAAYLIEFAAAQQAKGVVGKRKKSDAALNPPPKDMSNGNSDSKAAAPSPAPHAYWRLIALAHGLNATLCLLVTNVLVYFQIYHPGIGTICEFHAIVVWLKICSYAFTNRDLRHAMLHPALSSSLPEIYSTCPYPQNVTLRNLCYFWWAPTLVYQPVYPRTERIRRSFLLKRIAEVFALCVFIWLASAQYAVPVLRNSVGKIAVLDVPSIAERVMKLSTISLIIWLAGFFALFQSFLNALAEVMCFADREFYTDWWNSPSVGTYWRTWNKPVYSFMKRHIYSPLIGRGWNPNTASIMVFVFSGVLHELLVGIPTHNLLGVGFAAMVLQIPLIAMTRSFERKESPMSRAIGNTIFWVSFCLLGQPIGELIYFFAWQSKFGSINSKEQIGLAMGK